MEQDQFLLFLYKILPWNQLDWIPELPTVPAWIAFTLFTYIHSKRKGYNPLIYASIIFMLPNLLPLVFFLKETEEQKLINKNNKNNTSGGSKIGDIVISKNIKYHLKIGVPVFLLILAIIIFFLHEKKPRIISTHVATLKCAPHRKSENFNGQWQIGLAQIRYNWISGVYYWATIPIDKYTESGLDDERVLVNKNNRYEDIAQYIDNGRVGRFWINRSSLIVRYEATNILTEKIEKWAESKCELGDENLEEIFNLSVKSIKRLYIGDLKI